jgi:hypothetical protein
MSTTIVITVQSGAVMNLYVPADANHTDVLAGLSTLTTHVHTIQETLMGMRQDYETLVTRIDTATNNVAAVLTQLRDQIGSNMTLEEEQAVKASLDAQITRLEALGSNPENPVPEEPPTEPTTPTEPTVPEV